MRAVYDTPSTVKSNWLVCAVFTALAPWSSGADAPKLEYAVILSRHGVRSPTWEPNRLNEYSAAPWPNWGVPPGHLTPHGRKLIELLGAYYRQWFLGDGLLKEGSCVGLYIWADTDQRTIETGRAFADSMLPGCEVPVHSVEGGQKDALFEGLGKVDPQAAAQAVLARLGPHPEQRAAHYRDLLKKLQFTLDGGGKRPAKSLDLSAAIDIAAEGKALELKGPLATASTLSEDFLLEYSNGMSGADFGWGRLSKADLLDILRLHDLYADLMRRTPVLARPRGSNLLAHIRASLEQAATGKPVAGAIGPPGTSVLILSGHDTNQSNVSGMLDLTWKLPGSPQDETLPGGALIFTLWRAANDEKFVRLQYIAASLDQMHDLIPVTLAAPPESTPVQIRGCAASACTWQEFTRTVAGAIDPSAVSLDTR